jgi:YesN/AraC family two-component response regulator
MSIFDKERLKSLKEERNDKKHTIMIVDDEEAHLRSMESLLSEDYYIITARDGKEALDIIEKMEQPEEISLIISDQRMSRLTGLQLFEKIKDSIPDTIRIIITGFDDKNVMLDSINKAKIYEFIMKPFEPEDLKRSVKRAVETFELHQKLDIYLQAQDERIQKLIQENKKLKETNKQIRKKLAVLNILESLIFNSQTREADIHKVFEKNLWILGTEYSIMSSNETLKNTVGKFFGKIYKGDSAKNRPDLLLAQDIKDSYLLIEFKRPTHKLDRTNESQTLSYRDELNTYFPNSRIEIMLIGGGIKRNISSQNLRDDVKYLSYQSVISRARNNLKWLIKDLKINSFELGVRKK